MFEEHEVYDERRGTPVHDPDSYEAQQNNYPDPDGFRFEEWDDDDDDVLEEEEEER